jgi:hypothetical protein
MISIFPPPAMANSAPNSFIGVAIGAKTTKLAALDRGRLAGSFAMRRRNALWSKRNARAVKDTPRSAASFAAGIHRRSDTARVVFALRQRSNVVAASYGRGGRGGPGSSVYVTLRPPCENTGANVMRRDARGHACSAEGHVCSNIGSAVLPPVRTPGSRPCQD